MDELPVEIKHCILSSLNIWAAGRTSVLSKSWKSAWESRPRVVLTEVNTYHCFLAFLERSLQRRIDAGFSVEALRLLRICTFSPPMSDAICRFAIATSLKELEIDVLSVFYTGFVLSLPSSSTLTKLKLSRIELKHGGNSRWEFPCLRSIQLKHIPLDSAVLQDLVSACPALELLTVEEAQGGGLTRLDLPRLGRLKEFEATLYPKTRNISIALRAPNLESFRCCWSTHAGIRVTPEIKLEDCETTLKELSISNILCTAEWLQSLISGFPNLEALALERIYGPATLKISSARLTDLHLRSCRELDVDTEIRAANLQHIKYECNSLPFYSLASSSLPKSVLIYCNPPTPFSYGTDWFDKLSELFVNINDMSNVVVSILCRKIAIAHTGLGDTLFDILLYLHRCTLGFRLCITSDYKSWERMIVRPDVDDIFVTSTYDFDNLQEFLLKKLPNGEVFASESRYKFLSKYLRSCTMGALDDWSEFKGDDELRLVLMRAYHKSSSIFTRYSLCWLGC